MNTIIVHSDFSPNADHAMHYAAQLADHIRAAVQLVNIYTVPVSINDIQPVMLISGEEMRKISEAGLERCKQELHIQYPNLPVTVESRLGDINYELETVCGTSAPVAIVMSTKKISAFENFLLGNTALSAVRYIHQPIIVLPPDAVFKAPQHIALATDLLNLDKMPVQKIAAFVQALGAELSVVHVVEAKEADMDTVNDLKEKLSPLSFDYQTIHDKEIVHGLRQYIQTNHIDLLLLIPHEHNLIERLFFNLHTKDIVKHMTVPVVCISE